MRLLNIHSFELREFDSATIPRYAITSHRWYRKDEASLKDVLKGRNTEKSGYKKVVGFAEYVKNNVPGIEWMWIDTCCINQESSQEVSTAVNSMFKWYRNAEICIAFLVDVSTVGDTQEFSQSDWFKRGWTLQELVAPHVVVFVSRDWQLLGHKGKPASNGDTKSQLGPSLESTIASVTGIPETILHDYDSSKDLSPEAKMLWTAGRQTTVEEDMSYCLLGFFDVTMVANYGEGGAKARERLSRKISKASGISDSGQRAPEMQIPQSFTVPYLRDPDFVDRPELQHVESKVLSHRARIAVLGLGGVGKSQLAIECCYRLRDKSPEKRILWIHASNAARFDEGMQKLADDVEISGGKDSKAELFQLVHNWLSDSKKGNWCLVLDSADDADFLFEPPNSGVGEGAGANAPATRRTRVDYLPICAHGSVIVTTRSREVASKITDEQDVISIQPMDERHAVALLENKLGIHIDATAAAELAAELDYMPLAIAQAAAYIKKRAPRCSPEQYLAAYRKNDKSRTRLLNADSKELRRDREASSSILLTWQISFEHIYGSRRSAANLLSLMSFFDHQSIPECLLRSDDVSFKQQRSFGDSTSDRDVDADDGSAIWEGEDFEDDISTLRDYLFITVLPDGFTFKMHRLVQLAARNWLISHEQYQQWAKRSLQNLDSLFVEIDRDRRTNLQQCRMFYPHARLALDLELDDMGASLRCASILYKAACFACDQGSYVQAELLASKSTRLRRLALGDKDRETLKSEIELANALHQQGRYQAAEEASRKTVDSCTEALGKEDPTTLKSVSDLADVLLNRGQYEAAESLERQALEGRERVLGKDHCDTLRSVSDLADILERQGKFQAAEEMCRRAVRGFETTLGEEHVVTLNCVVELAWLLMRQANYPAAENLFLQALQVQQKILGKEHPLTLWTMSDTAVVLSRQGKHAEAETMIRQTIKAMEKVLGKEHPKTLNSLSRLGVILNARKEYKASEEIYRQAFGQQEKVLGKVHPHTLMSLDGLGAALRCQKKYQEAEEMHLRAVEGYKKALGPEHLNALKSILNLAILYRLRQRYDEATVLFEHVHSGMLRVAGPSHPETVACVKQINVLRRQVEAQKLQSAAGKLSLAEESQKEAGRA